MDNLIIKETSKSFYINCKRGLIEISGCSIVNDPKVFFKPIQKWTNDYLKDPPEETIIEIKIDFVDSASTKFLFEILKSFEKVASEKIKFKLNWYYDQNDPEILELGEILAGRLKINFNFIKY